MHVVMCNLLNFMEVVIVSLLEDNSFKPLNNYNSSFVAFLICGSCDGIFLVSLCFERNGNFFF